MTSLAAWVQWLVKSNQQVQGTDVETHLDSFARLKGQKRESVEPPIPRGGKYLLELFLELNQTRQSGMSVCAITFQEIRAFCDVMQVQLEPWEVDCIKVLDLTLLEELQKQEKTA